jgi:uncharacterized membrane protein SpoIIM required for sporulation
MSMNTSLWLKKRKPHWDRLEELVRRSGRRGLSELTARELRETGLLYRQVAADLATVREDPRNQRMAEYLNRLLGAAHNLIYLGRRPGASGILHFYRSGYPRIFRETISYTMAAFTLFLAGALAGMLATLADPGFTRFFLGHQMADTIARRQMWTHSVIGVQPLASSSIMTNNLTVSLTAFATGFTVVGTVYMMVFNGLLIGVIGAACWQAGMSVDLWSFVAPHGALELPAIFLAGGGGLLIARGLLFPGLLSRREAIQYYGGQGVRLALGVIPLLVIAGSIEGFFSPSEAPVPLKFAVSMAMGLGLYLYLRLGGRADEATASPVPSPASTR